MAMANVLRLGGRSATAWARVLQRRVFAFRPTSTTAANGSCPAQRGRCDVFQLGLTPFTEAWELQKAMQLRRMRNQDTTVDAALLLEHPPVYTLGRGASEDNIKFDHRLGPDGGGGPSAPVVAEVLRIERGGEVTYHGPGQLVLYPILNLNRHKRDLHWYMRQCEEVVIRTLADYGIAAARDQAYTGVWVGPGFALKIAAMGFSVSRWVTMHGLALNVDTDLDPFDEIVPCGIDESGRGVTSVLEQLRCTDAAAADNLDKGEVAARLLHHFADVFTLNLACHEPGTPVE